MILAIPAENPVEAEKTYFGRNVREERMHGLAVAIERGNKGKIVRHERCGTRITALAAADMGIKWNMPIEVPSNPVGLMTFAVFWEFIRLPGSIERVIRKRRIGSLLCF
jgi:hypothetical protein